MTEALALRPVPELIQGGMGVAVSDYELANAVAKAGEKLGKPVLGVISGTGLPIVMVDRLQRGGTKAREDTIRALNVFDPEFAKEIINEYSPDGRFYKLAPKPEVLVTSNEKIKAKLNKLAVAAAFVEVSLAKEGHNGPIGINLLEKIQLMHLPTILGAMMAGVDYVIVGAGIPNQVPRVLKDFAENNPASYKLDVAGLKEGYKLTLDPAPFIPQGKKLKKPKFFAIVSHHALAERLAKTVEVDGFVIEGPIAGGHNAPARSNEKDELGQPIYGERDEPDLNKIGNLGLPFYLAGGTFKKLKEAKQLGATGIQVGTAFALSMKTGLEGEIAQRLRAAIADDTLEVTTSSVASPSGYPFQVAKQKDSLSEAEVYRDRKRICNLGYLVRAYLRADGSIGFRCPAEPITIYVKKGGVLEETEGKICLCNGLIAACGHGLAGEPMIITLGKDLSPVKELMNGRENGHYQVEDVIEAIYAAA